MSPEDDIRALVVEFMAAWNRHDPNAFAEVFSEDADFTNWQGASVHGRAAIAHLHAPVFASRFRESHLSPDAVRIRVLRDGLAGVDVHWRMTGARDAEDQTGTRAPRDPRVGRGRRIGRMEDQSDAQHRHVEFPVDPTAAVSSEGVAV